MAGTPVIPPNLHSGIPSSDGNQQPPPGPPPPPGTDMTGISFREQLFLDSYTLNRELIFDYFALSGFYDVSCNNEQLRQRSIHPLDMSQLSTMKGVEYVLSEVTEPHLFVIRKQRRDDPKKVTPMLTYYVLDGTIYQAPQLCNVFSSRIGRALYHISKAFTSASSKLEKIGFVDDDNEDTALKPKVVKEAINYKDMKRVDIILKKLQQKLPPAPPPPSFPEGFIPPSTETDNGSEKEQTNDPSDLPPDPIIEQGPTKRMKYH